MSEQIRSKTAEGEALQDQPSLLEKARGIIGKPIGKFIGGAMIIGAVAGTTKEAVADTVACVTIDANGQGNYLVTDKIGSTKTDGVIGPNTLEYTLQNEPPLVFNDRLLAHSYKWNDSTSKGEDSYKEFDPQLNYQGIVSWPGNNINQIIGEEKGIGISGNYFYHLNENIFELMGTGAESQNPNNNQAFGGYVFVRSLTASTSPQKYIIDIFNEADLSLIKEWYIGEDADGGIISSGNGLAIDEGVKSILTGVNTINGNGYIEVPFGDFLGEDGKFKNANFAQDNPSTGFKKTGFPVSEIYIDSNGTRFFKSNTGSLHVETENQGVKTYPEIQGVGTIKGITVLPSGGLYIIEEGATNPKILKADGGLTEPDFPGNGEYGVIQGCNAIDSEWEPNDPNSEEVETAEEVGDVIESEDTVESDAIEDTGSDTQFEDRTEETDDGTDTTTDPDIQDVIGDEGTDEEVSADGITPDTSTGDTIRPDTASQDTESDGSIEPEDVTDTDTTPEETNKPGGCSSVPGGVADTRGALTLLLAGLAALGIKRRRDAVKSRE